MAICFCSPLHETCDPARCNKAGPFKPGPERTPFPDIGKNGCTTCEIIVRGILLPEINSVWDRPEWKDEPDGKKLKIGWAPGTRIIRTAANENGASWRHFAFSLSEDSLESEVCLGFDQEKQSFVALHRIGGSDEPAELLDPHL